MKETLSQVQLDLKIMSNRYAAVMANETGIYYLTPRRATGNLYEDRASWSLNVDDAKIFMTKGAASNSANRVILKDATLKIAEVKITLE